MFTCQKDARIENHHILAVKNVHALDAMRSLKSRGFVREVFNWCVLQHGRSFDTFSPAVQFSSC